MILAFIVACGSAERSYKSFRSAPREDARAFSPRLAGVMSALLSLAMLFCATFSIIADLE
jgi:hypothetical protein